MIGHFCVRGHINLPLLTAIWLPFYQYAPLGEKELNNEQCCIDSPGD
jgi:hypothetical protein